MPGPSLSFLNLYKQRGYYRIPSSPTRDGPPPSPGCPESWHGDSPDPVGKPLPSLPCESRGNKEHSHEPGPKPLSRLPHIVPPHFPVQSIRPNLPVPRPIVIPPRSSSLICLPGSPRRDEHPLEAEDEADYTAARGFGGTVVSQVHAFRQDCRGRLVKQKEKAAAEDARKKGVYLVAISGQPPEVPLEVDEMDSPVAHRGVAEVLFNADETLLISGAEAVFEADVQIVDEDECDSGEDEGRVKVEDGGIESDESCHSDGSWCSDYDIEASDEEEKPHRARESFVGKLVALGKKGAKIGKKGKKGKNVAVASAVTDLVAEEMSEWARVEAEDYLQSGC